ncbi:MAG: hypothetical protein QOF69_3947 [Solirubrobacteraceae bacterium]|nr:hypothetical protein [Solirubrobacteraceae bacterium]
MHETATAARTSSALRSGRSEKNWSPTCAPDSAHSRGHSEFRDPSSAAAWRAVRSSRSRTPPASRLGAGRLRGRHRRPAQEKSISTTYLKQSGGRTHVQPDSFWANQRYAARRYLLRCFAAANPPLSRQRMKRCHSLGSRGAERVRIGLSRRRAGLTTSSRRRRLYEKNYESHSVHEEPNDSYSSAHSLRDPHDLSTSKHCRLASTSLATPNERSCHEQDSGRCPRQQVLRTKH